MNLEATRRNEKRKLGALWCNGVSIASVAIGIFTPIATAIFDLEKAGRSSGELGFTLDRCWPRLCWLLSAGHS